MPLFEIGDEELIPFRRVIAGPDLYEQEIEALLWSNLDAFVGIPLFPVARQPKIGVTYRARVLGTGPIQLDVGEWVYASPSRAAMEVAGIVAYDDWHAWRTAGGHLLADLRGQLLASNSPAEESNG